MPNIPRKERTFLDFLQMQRKGMAGDDDGIALVDAMLSGMGKNGALLRTRFPMAPAVLILGSRDIRAKVAEKLKDERFNTDRYLEVIIEDDRRMNAAVENEPPYHVYVSTNMFLYSARLGELLMAGLGISGPEGSNGMAPQRSHEEVGNAIRSIIEGFISGRTVPERELALDRGYGAMPIIVQFTLLAFIMCHEFGHVVIAESRRRKLEVPFAAFARQQLERAFPRIVSGTRHDPDDRAGLRKMSDGQLEGVFEKWLEEINADIIAGSLALEYQDSSSLLNGVPQGNGFAQMGIHVGMLAHMFLHVYRNYKDPDHKMVTATHPPIDFRLYCIQLWLYRDDFVDVVRPWTEYTQSVMRYVLEKGGRPPVGHKATLQR